MNPLIVLPVIHNETAVKCIDSLDLRLQLSHLLIVDNSVGKFTKQWPMSDELFHIERPEGNIGVGRAWNIGVKEVLINEFDFLIILSASVVFNDGMLGFIKELENIGDAKGLMTQEGWHCLAISRKVFEEVGIFDTNFYPGYYEDSDFIRRMELAGIHEPTGSKTLPGCTIDAQKAEVAHGMKRAGVRVNMGACRDYFIEKWGNEPRYTSQADRDSLYKHPFNNPEFGLDYFPNHTIEELKFKYQLS